MEENNGKRVKIAAVADIHVREHDKGKWANLFKEISHQADVLLICGDLTDTGDEVQLDVLNRGLAPMSAPTTVVVYNGDPQRDGTALGTL